MRLLTDEGPKQIDLKVSDSGWLEVWFEHKKLITMEPLASTATAMYVLALMTENNPALYEEALRRFMDGGNSDEHRQSHPDQ